MVKLLANENFKQILNYVKKVITKSTTRLTSLDGEGEITE